MRKWITIVPFSRQRYFVLPPLLIDIVVGIRAPTPTSKLWTPETLPRGILALMLDGSVLVFGHMPHSNQLRLSTYFFSRPANIVLIMVECIFLHMLFSSSLTIMKSRM